MEFSRDNCVVRRTPSEDEVLTTWDITRADPKKTIAFRCMSTELFGIDTHHTNGRTGPHLRSGCICNTASIPIRPLWYVAALRENDRRRCLVEFPSGAALALDAAFKDRGSLRMTQFILGRVKDKPNAKVRITVTSDQAWGGPAVEEPDIFAVLCKIWGLSQQIAVAFGEFAEHAFSEEEKAKIAEQLGGKAHDIDWTRGTPRLKPKRGKIDRGNRDAA